MIVGQKMRTRHRQRCGDMNGVRCFQFQGCSHAGRLNQQWPREFRTLKAQLRIKKIVILLGKSPVPVGEGLDEAFMQRQFAGHGSYGTAIELQEEGSMCRRQRANFLNGINGDISIEVDTSAPE